MMIFQTILIKAKGVVHKKRPAVTGFVQSWHFADKGKREFFRRRSPYFMVQKALVFFKIYGVPARTKEG